MITQADIDAAAAFFRDNRTGLATKFNLGHDPSPLLDAFERHREEAELRGIELGLEAARHALRDIGVEYTCCEQTIDMAADAIFALDPAAVQRGE